MTAKKGRTNALLLSVLAAVVIAFGVQSTEALLNRVARQTDRVLTGENVFARKSTTSKKMSSSVSMTSSKKSSKKSGGKKSQPARAATTPKSSQKRVQKPTQKPASKPQSRPQSSPRNPVDSMKTSAPTCMECDEIYPSSQESPVVSPSPNSLSSTLSSSGSSGGDGGSSEMTDEPGPTTEVSSTEAVVSSASVGLSLIVTSLSLGSALLVVMCV